MTGFLRGFGFVGVLDLLLFGEETTFGSTVGDEGFSASCLDSRSFLTMERYELSVPTVASRPKRLLIFSTIRSSGTRFF